MRVSFTTERKGAGNRARSGRLVTSHGAVETPTLVPLATAGAVQSLTPDDLLALGIRIVAVDGFELACRPGVERIAALGGLRAMIGWPGPLLALSGSQRYLGQSVPDEAAIREFAARVRASGGSHGRAARPGRLGSTGDAGLRIASPIDGAMQLLRPEDVVANAETLEADIALALDQPSAAGELPATGRAAARAAERAGSWAMRAAVARRGELALVDFVAADGVARTANDESLPNRSIAGVAQRAEAWRVSAEDWPALSASEIGVFVGGVDPIEIAAAAAAGADLIVTAAPTALADLGVLYTDAGTVDARDQSSERDGRPIEPGCGCPTCRQHSRAYIRHLFVADELLGYRLAAIHNLHHLIGRLNRLRVE
jgi:queuine tRNA-ribosyltransferase